MVSCYLNCVFQGKASDGKRPFIHGTKCGNVYHIRHILNRIGGVMVRVFALSAVDRGFEPRSGQTKL
jgi:hypothetical protein